MTVNPAEPDRFDGLRAALQIDGMWLDRCPYGAAALRVWVGAAWKQFPDGFWLNLDTAEPSSLRFAPMGFVESRNLYEAVEWRPGHVKGPVEGVPPLALQGPWMKGS
ncbi:hypothetical protein KGY14_09620 [Ameyamaea chiangmaiensis]|uniref:hypothetical protein n=1 Tax=Ameyamaea chiangmaiensis TaxID=442969 RepID=UPI001BAFF485|nr:hypothetical protein [Ameyamaea chiangmaiensis]MBS4075447.1 hypothetical protein [Ameyamaea chiangmaiensis]